MCHSKPRRIYIAFLTGDTYGWIFLVLEKAQVVPESLGSSEPLRGIWGCVRAREAVTKTRFVRGSPADGSELTLSAFTEPYDSCAEPRRMAIIRWCFWHGRIEVGRAFVCTIYPVFSVKPSINQLTIWNVDYANESGSEYFLCGKNSCWLLYQRVRVCANNI